MSELTTKRYCVVYQFMHTTDMADRRYAVDVHRECVDSLLAEGWEPQGGVALALDGEGRLAMMQAMVKG